MAVQFSYKVNGVRVNSAAGLTDVVKQVEIMVTGKDGEAQFQLPVLVDLGDPNPANFTPFASMTEEQLVEWANSAPADGLLAGMPSRMDGVRAHIAHVVAKEVERLALKEKPLPWAPPPAPVTPVAPPPTDG